MRYFVNEQKGVRPVKANMFSYKRKGFILKDISLIDTNAIYVRKIIKYRANSDRIREVYYRFWANGRVQEVWPGDENLNDIVNNTEIGYIGYYLIKDGRLQMQLIEENYGGQTALKFGGFADGNIWLYNARPEMYFGSYGLLEASEAGNTQEWVKTRLDSLKYVKPIW